MFCCGEDRHIESILRTLPRNDNFYYCFYDRSSPDFKAHDFGDSRKNLKKIADSKNGSPEGGRHYAIKHSHSNDIANKIDSVSKSSILEMIKQVENDIIFFKDELRSYSPRTQTSKRIICKEIAEDEALLVLLKAAYDSR
jgi:hypothetical protein